MLRSDKPAALTLAEMYLQAISMECKRIESSPVAAGILCCSDKMKWVSVMFFLISDFDCSIYWNQGMKKGNERFKGEWARNGPG